MYAKYEKYANPIIIAILLTICCVLYYRYTTKEGFQDASGIDLSANDLSANQIDLGSLPTVDIKSIYHIPMPQVKPTGTTQAEAEAALKAALAPIIAANPDALSINDIPSISTLNKDKIMNTIANTPRIDPTAIDRRLPTDIGRQCDMAESQITTFQNTIEKYKMSNSWPQVQGVTKSISVIQQHMRDLGC